MSSRTGGTSRYTMTYRERAEAQRAREFQAARDDEWAMREEAARRGDPDAFAIGSPVDQRIRRDIYMKHTHSGPPRR